MYAKCVPALEPLRGRGLSEFEVFGPSPERPALPGGHVEEDIARGYRVDRHPRVGGSQPTRGRP
jgi:hypothetical protein